MKEERKNVARVGIIFFIMSVLDFTLKLRKRKSDSTVSKVWIRDVMLQE